MADPNKLSFLISIFYFISKFFFLNQDTERWSWREIADTYFGKVWRLKKGWEHKEVFLIGAQYPKTNIKPFFLNCEIMSVAEQTGINGL